MNFNALPVLLFSGLSLFTIAANAAPDTQAAAGAPRVLLFSKTEGFRHGSINTARSAISQVLTDDGIAVDTSEDENLFTSADLGQYDAVVFLMTTGDILDNTQ